MKRLYILMLLMVQAACVFAQGQVKGKILDKANDEPLGFVNVVINQAGENKMVKGAITDEQGNFHFEGLANGNYDLVVTIDGKTEDEVVDLILKFIG